MDFDLSGRVAAITGATSGIGEATALSLSQAGAAVALAGRREDRLEELAKRIEDDGGRARAIPTDVTDEGKSRALIELTVSELGGLSILVNNAGVMLSARPGREPRRVAHDGRRQPLRASVLHPRRAARAA